MYICICIYNQAHNQEFFFKAGDVSWNEGNFDKHFTDKAPKKGPAGKFFFSKMLLRLHFK